jgi:hypothetical protein
MQPRRVSVLLTIFALFVLLPCLSAAGDTSPKEARNAISTDILEPVLQLVFNASIYDSSITPFEISYQRVLLDNIVLSGVIRIGYRPSIGNFDMSPWVELDWHPFDNGLRGFFFGPALSTDFSLNTGNSFYGGLGAALGYQIFLPWNIMLAGVSGLTYGPEFFRDSIVFRPSVRLVIALGYRF